MTRVTNLVLVLALLACAIPAWRGEMPPLLDYPNHLARLWLIEGGANRPPLSQIYALDWSHAWTNILIDLMALLCRGVVPAAVVGRLMLSVALVLPPLGAALLGGRLFGRHPWHVLVCVLAWNIVLLQGFLNFEISLGLALVAAAADGAVARCGVVLRTVVRGAIGVGLLIAHPFGLMLYAALLGGLAVGADFQALRPRRLAGTIRGVLAACWPAFIPVLLLVVLAPTLPGSDTVRGDPSTPPVVWQDGTLKSLAFVLLTGVETYRPELDAPFAVLLGLPVLVAAWAGRLRVHAGLLVAVGGLTLGAMLAPQEVLGTWGIEQRLPCMIPLVLAAGLLPGWRVPKLADRLALAVALAAVLGRAVVIDHIWQTRQGDIASLDRALAPVPAGAAVLPLEHLPDDGAVARAPVGRFAYGHPTFWHLPVLAVMQRQAFVPTLFAAAGKQPVRVLPPWNALAVREGGIAPVDQLGDPATQVGAYAARWRGCYGFLLVVNADLANAGGPLPAWPAIVPVVDAGFARLYRLEAGGAGCDIMAVVR